MARARALIALLFVALYPAAVAGSHGGPIGSRAFCDRPVVPPRCTSVGNNLRHYVYFDDSLTDGLAASLGQSMAEAYDEPTQLTMVVQDEINGATDVIAFSSDYGQNGAAGWVYCPPGSPQGENTRGDRWCQRQEMRFNLNPSYAIFFADDASRDHVTCHELGHTLGLRHWGNPPQSDGPVAATCLNSNTPNGPTSLHQFDIEHINAYDYVPPRPPGRFLTIASILGAGGVSAIEGESFGSIEEMTGSADAVIRGRITAAEAGRVFGDPETDPFHYAAATVAVDGLLAGALSSEHAGSLTLEIPMFGGPGSLPEVRAALTGAEVVLFLRNKGHSARQAGLSAGEAEAESAYYRLVSFGALAVNESGRAAVPDAESSALAELDGLAFEDAVRRIGASAP